MISKPVIVTALFDIGRERWDSFSASYHTYLWWLKNTLSLDANFVIYTDNRFYYDILEIRKEFDPTMTKSKVIKCTLEHLPAYLKYNKRMEILMYSNKFKEKINFLVPEMTKPLYNTITFNKLFFIKDAKDHNYFNSDLYIWVDAGGLREDIKNFKGITWPNLTILNKKIPKDKISLFTHHSDFFIDNKESHAMSQMRYIQGGSLFCPPELIDNFCDNFNNTVRKCLDNSYIGSDEKIFDILYVNNKNLYNLIKSNWRGYFDIFK